MVGRGDWDMLGYVVTEPLTHTLQMGWNLIGVPVPANRLHAADVVASAGQDAATGVHRLIEINRWVYGGYEAHIAAYPLNDFLIESDRAYFVRATRAFQWSAPATGGGPAGSPAPIAGW